MMKRLLLVSALLLVATAGLALASTLRARPFTGVVVARQHGVMLVAGSRGTVRAVRGSLHVGARVSLGGSHVTRLGTAHRARVRGVLVARAHGVTFLSAARHVIAIRSGRRAASADATPGASPGTIVVATVAIDDHGNLDEQGEDEVGRAGQVQVVATVTAVGVNTVTVSVNGQTLVIPLPPGTATAGITVGSQIELTLTFPGGAAQATPNARDDDDPGDDDSGDDDHGHESSTTTTTTTTTTATSSDDGDSHGGGSDDGNSHDGGGHH
jgi:hypothetical protein